MIIKHAYLIMAHRDAYTLRRLLELLDDGRNDVYLHVDARSTMDVARLKDSVKEAKLIFTRRIPVYWADYSQVSCELLLLEAAMSSGQVYHYYHLLSGADLPLTSQDEIHAFFLDNQRDYFHETALDNKKESVTLYHLFQKQVGQKAKYRNISIFKLINALCLKIQKIVKVNRVSATISIKTGANWWSLTDKTVQYVVSQKEVIYKWFRYTKNPDEFFLQTILANSACVGGKACEPLLDDYACCLREIDWQRGTPYVYRAADLDHLISSTNFFARKFDSDIDKEIIDALYYEVKGRQGG